MHIIGGGIIGLCCAWYLRKAGHDVTVIDRTDIQDGCSFGNAGLVVPSHFVPLASPGVVTKGFRWMFRRDSPFYISPKPDPALWQWIWQFYRSCNPSHVARAIPLLYDFHMLSKSLYEDFASQPEFGFDFEKQGILMLFRSQKGHFEEEENAEKAQSLGMQVTELTSDEVTNRTGLAHNTLGGFYYAEDAHLYPGKFIQQLQGALRASGVKFITGKGVARFNVSGQKVNGLVLDNGEVIEIEEVVVAAGAWTGKLLRQLGIKLLMQDGKGYSVTLSNYSHRPALPVILSEARVAVTPMGSDLRIGGTLEISQFSDKINKVRVNAILKAMSLYFPSFPKMNTDQVDVWFGYRPVSADGLPYIGRAGNFDNVIVAAGHAMLGMSLGPATGLLVSEIAQGHMTSIPIELLSPGRHGA